jgi:mutator protein MutT
MSAANRFHVDVLILVVDDSGRVLMTERAGDIYMAGYWAIPGGKVDPGEPVTEAAARELQEEVGISVSPDRCRFIAVTHHRPPHGDARVGFGFVVTDWSGEPRNLEPDKCSSLGWFPPDALPAKTMPYTAEILRLFHEKEPFSLHGWPASGDPTA